MYSHEFPKLSLDSDVASSHILIKGQSPKNIYPFTLRDIYSVIPTLNLYDCYQYIHSEFNKVNYLLDHFCKLRATFKLPSISGKLNSASLLNVLFDPTCYYNYEISNKIKNIHEHKSEEFPTIINAPPFPLLSASPEKFLHTLAWIDANIKISIEGIFEHGGFPSDVLPQIAESIFKIFSYLIKQEDNRLVNSMNFNHSMFLQDRILNLIFGDAVYLASDERSHRNVMANRITIELLKGLNDLTYSQLCELSVFMGVIRTNHNDYQRAFRMSQSETLSNIESQLAVLQKKWHFNHIEQFLEDMGKSIDMTISVILDDNGESVIDLVLFQRLLKDNGHLKVNFIINLYPVSINIAVDTFYQLINDPYFDELRQQFRNGQATLCQERQAYRSFQYEYLQKRTRLMIEKSKAAYIKGANFFETFQIPNITRYHSFVIHHPISCALTGSPAGKGLFVKLLPNEPGYIYNSYSDIKTLKDILLYRKD